MRLFHGIAFEQLATAILYRRFLSMAEKASTHSACSIHGRWLPSIALYPVSIGLRFGRFHAGSRRVISFPTVWRWQDDIRPDIPFADSLKCFRRQHVSLQLLKYGPMQPNPPVTCGFPRYGPIGAVSQFTDAKLACWARLGVIVSRRS